VSALFVLDIPQALQAEGSWHEAERHFCEAKEWKGAVAMYRQQGSWDDALRVAKVLGGLEAAKQVGTGSTQCGCAMHFLGWANNARVVCILSLGTSHSLQCQKRRPTQRSHPHFACNHMLKTVC
jgi:hypothetical protein